MEDAKPHIIAGPCSVESREQLFAVVDALAEMPQVELIRCGVWKPRTRPGGFEGLGEQALAWMAEAKSARPSLRFACEVARPEHAQLALRYGVDAVWIGARTTANPFMVQELGEALRGTRLTVMVKNAPSPDVRLWMGAIERFLKVGIPDVRAIHRGFDVFQHAGYRNTPLWEIPIELRRLMPDIPLICDPSHIAGRREPLLTLSQTAFDMGFDGLMLEVHPSPELALTDSEQQLTPADFLTLVQSLVIRSKDTNLADQELRLLRSQIDRIDDQLLQLLAQRLSVSQQIAQVKQRDNLAVFQPKRWESLLQKRLDASEQIGLDAEFVKHIYETIHAESVRVQQELLGDSRNMKSEM